MVHQVDPRLRRRRRPALPRADDQRGGGPAVHRPTPGGARERGHRDGGPDRAADRHRRRAGGAVDRDARGETRARRRRRSTWRPHRNRGPSSPPSGRRWPTSPRARRARSRRICATGTTRARANSATRVGYRYPHNDPDGVLPQQYPPDELVGVDYYEPTQHGAEREVAVRIGKLRRIVRGAPDP